MEIKINHTKKEFFQAIGKTTIEWKLSKNWKNIIAAPVIQHCLAPREAKAILEIIGHLRDHGISFDVIIENIIESYNIKFKQENQIDFFSITLLEDLANALLKLGKVGAGLPND